MTVFMGAPYSLDITSRIVPFHIVRVSPKPGPKPTPSPSPNSNPDMVGKKWFVD